MKNEILNLILKRDWYRNKFKKCSVKELTLIYTLLENDLKTDNGNWSSNRLLEFTKKYRVSPYNTRLNLKDFYEIYSKRKKKRIVFESFLNRLDDEKIPRNQIYHNTKERKMLGVNDKADVTKKDNILNLLSRFKEIKKDYLIGRDDEFVKMISDSIDTGYKESTLRIFYYDA